MYLWYLPNNNAFVQLTKVGDVKKETSVLVKSDYLYIYDT